MKLIASPTSPFARKIRVIVIEKQLDCPTIMDIPWSEDTKVPDYNPLGKIPVLVLADGSSIYDSRVIAEYLDTLPANLRLIPEDAVNRIAVRRIEALADGIGDAAVAIFLELNRRPAAQQNAEWIARQQQKIDRGLEVLAREVPAEGWLIGGSYSLADIVVGCNLDYLSLRLPALDWQARHPGLKAYMERLAARESFQQTVPPV